MRKKGELFIESDNRIRLVGLHDTGDDSWINDATVKMSTHSAYPAVSEVQKLSLTEVPSGGTFTLKYGDQTSGAIAYNASAATVLAALEALSNLAVGEVSCSGGPLPVSDIYITFIGNLKTKTPEALIADGTNLTNDTSCSVDETVKGVVAVNEVQRITITGTPTGGDFTIEYDGQVTAAILYNADIAAIKTALELLSNIDQVACTGGPLPGTPINIEFQTTLAAKDVELMIADGSGLTGGTSPDAAITQETQGVAAVNEKQTITLTDSTTPSGGTFTLQFGSYTSEPIAYNATAAVVKEALEFLPTIDDNDITATGGPVPTTDIVVEFVGSHAAEDVALLVIDDTNLTFASADAVLVEETAASAILNTGNITLSYIPDSNGDYEGIIPDDAPFVDGTDYYVVITATKSSLVLVTVLPWRARYHGTPYVDV